MKEHKKHSPVANLNGSPDPGQPAAVQPADTAPLPVQARDELALLLDKSTDYNPNIPAAEFLFHALLRNMGRATLEVVEEWARVGAVPNYISQYLYDFTIGEQDPDEVGNAKMVKDMIVESRQLWATVGILLRPFVVEHESAALIYQRLYDEPDTSIDEVRLDTAPIWQR